MRQATQRRRRDIANALVLFALGEPSDPSLQALKPICAAPEQRDARQKPAIPHAAGT